MESKSLRGKVVVVAGATRGAGRAIAITLGEAGATVHVTGRSVQGKSTMVVALKPLRRRQNW
jgi:NAD(P)-dependent dehydrogenase (short-subunit alcohol dehydrogenase family)